MSPATTTDTSEEVDGYRLYWKKQNHQTTIIQALFEERSFVDVTLSAGGRSLQVHRIVLSAASPYLKDILSQHTDKKALIILDEVPFNQLEALVEFMYRGEVSVAPELLPNLLSTAEALQIKGLTESDHHWSKMNSVEQRNTNGKQSDQMKTESGCKASVPPSTVDSSAVTALISQPSSSSLAISPFVLGTTTSSITQMLHQPIYTSNLLPSNLLAPQGHSNSVMSNGGDFGLTSNSGIKLETQQQRPGSSSVANSENDEWSDADLGPSTPVHTNSNPNVAVEVIHHHQAFVNTSQFPHWNESLAAAAAAVVSSAVGSLVPGPSGIQYLQAATASTPAPPPATAPVRGKQRNNRRPTRQPNTNASTTLIQEKPYVCPRCGRCYSRRGALIQHQRYECGIEPQFSCPMCPYKIKRKDSLNRHIRNMHHNHQSN